MVKLKLGLIFGGRSVEHEVSVITAIQAFENLDKSKYEVVPIYVSKKGLFYTSQKFLLLKNFKDLDSLLLSFPQITFARKEGKSGIATFGMFPKFINLDVVYPLIHGSFGEDGSLQGVLEIFQIPYIGFNVLGSAVGMDKIISKYIFQALGIPIGKFVVIKRSDFQKNSKKALGEAKNLKYPLVVKPGDIGSSIGVNKVLIPDDLEFNVEVALVYSDFCLIEEGFERVIEVNCAALGYKDPIVSLCEEPIGKDTTLSFKDKYQSGGSKNSPKNSGMAYLTRKIPAPISKDLTKKIQDTTLLVFKTLEGCGVARVDYFVDPETGKFWINEINTIPGSQSFYLFEPMGIPYKKELDILVEGALDRFSDQNKTQFSFESGLLSQMAVSGGVKH